MQQTRGRRGKSEGCKPTVPPQQTPFHCRLDIDSILPARSDRQVFFCTCPLGSYLQLPLVLNLAVGRAVIFA